MNYANEGILELGYRKDEKKRKRTSFLKRHKIISMMIFSTAILTIVNGFMICEFIKILTTL